MRADLNQPATAVFGTLGEQACVRGIRLAWQMAEDEEGLASLPSRQIARQLVEEGCPEPLARRAMGVMGLVTSLTRDPTMRYEPNVEMTDADDEQLLSLLRQTIASRMQHRRYPDTVTAEQVTAAVHGDDAPAAAVDAYRHALSLSPLQVMADALTPVLMPAPVLWDVATAVTHLPQSWVLSTTEQFRGAVLAPLESLERDIDTVPMEAAYLALRSSGVLDGPEGDIRNAYADGQPTEVAERVVRTWVTTLLQRRLLVPAELMSMESLYRLVLPDRVQTEGRAWVRDIVASSID